MILGLVPFLQLRFLMNSMKPQVWMNLTCHVDEQLVICWAYKILYIRVYIYIYVERDCIYILYHIIYTWLGTSLGINLGTIHGDITSWEYHWETTWGYIYIHIQYWISRIFTKKNKWGMTIGQNLWNPRVNSHHISWEFLMLMFLICKNKAQMQGSLSHLAGFLQCLRKILDVDPQKIYGSIGLDTSPHRYGSSQIGPHLQVNMATMSVVCGYQNSLTCAHSVGEHVAAVGKPHHQKK